MLQHLVSNPHVEGQPIQHCIWGEREVGWGILPIILKYNHESVVAFGCRSDK